MCFARRKSLCEEQQYEVKISRVATVRITWAIRRRSYFSSLFFQWGDVFPKGSNRCTFRVTAVNSKQVALQAGSIVK